MIRLATDSMKVGLVPLLDYVRSSVVSVADLTPPGDARGTRLTVAAAAGVWGARIKNCTWITAEHVAELAGACREFARELSEFAENFEHLEDQAPCRKAVMAAMELLDWARYLELCNA